MPCIRIQFLPQTRFLEPARKRERKELPLRASRQVHNCCPELWAIGPIPSRVMSTISESYDLLMHLDKGNYCLYSTRAKPDSKISSIPRATCQGQPRDKLVPTLCWPLNQVRRFVCPSFFSSVVYDIPRLTKVETRHSLPTRFLGETCNSFPSLPWAVWTVSLVTSSCYRSRLVILLIYRSRWGNWCRIRFLRQVWGTGEE